MNAMQDDFPVTMICEDLNNIPPFSLPASHSFRWFQTGDEKIWQDIQARADQYNEITDELFSRQFGPDFDLLRERQCYLLDSNHKAIATATAWFNDHYDGQQYGRLHWVAVIPEMQGQGLAKPLLSIVCNKLKELGHKRAYLTTSTARLPAINLYLKFGFIPKLVKSQDRELWKEVSAELETQNKIRQHNDA